MNILLAAGGSAGHINPALAIADKVRDIFAESRVLFVGTQKGLESKLVTRAGYEFTAIKASGFQRKITAGNIARNAKSAYYFIAANGAARKIIEEFKPDVVVGTGGYVTAPVLRTAAKMGIPTATHESNSLPGMATKMLARTANKVFVASADTLVHFGDYGKASGKYVITGNPLRTLADMNRERALRSLNLKDGMTILSFGGSLGANKITRAVVELLKWEREGNKEINHIHAYGGNGRELFAKLLEQKGFETLSNRNIFAEYLHNMYTCIAAADLVICRAGSMSQTELKAFGRASIQIPWAGAAENHQYFNALTMQEAGAAVLIPDNEISGAKLIDTVSRLYSDRLQIRLMEEAAARMSSPDAAGLIVSELLDLKKS
ncbi:MAG: UDP-N-acetylglucosamine--N-acetylmuramyl-(pentapeptide) pyrophosphoryl-undecaprenol N-acetylglucosamine transferase [Oscillospiraceae bacterium]|nr:UDP-N-acetylglucosamine--N-acetylmuramyl-(pentapeptide) pyrophosphoryl-undecaprenol N-acetylglucosamine transferase [Oscillospiraceae bacterium]